MKKTPVFTVKTIPNSFTVREECSVELYLYPEANLEAGDTIEVQFPMSWTVEYAPSFTKELQTVDPQGQHYVAVSSENGKTTFDIRILVRQPWYPKGDVRHGRCISAMITEGGIAAGTAIRVFFANTTASYLAEREEVWIRINGAAPVREPELITSAGPAKTLRIIAPSYAVPGQEFVVLIVSLDRFDNCSSSHYTGKMLKAIDGTVVADNLDFQGSVKVPVRIAQPGIHRFVLDDYVSNAVTVAEGAAGPFWGDIHVHTKRSTDGIGTDPYRYAKDVTRLDFAATADHWRSLGRVGYEQNIAWAEEANTPGSFVTFFADERNPPQLMGHHNIYFKRRKDFERFAWYSHEDEKVPEFETKLYEELRNIDTDSVMIIPHHTGISFGRSFAAQAIDVNAFSETGIPESIRPVMEVFSMHGQSEYFAPDKPLSYELHRNTELEGRKNISVEGPFYARDYWMQGARLGVIGSSDCHSAQPGRSFSGLAAVNSRELSRDALFKAMRAGQCYATTGERILLEFSIEGFPMGTVLRRKPGSIIEVLLNVYGTTELTAVEILRYRFGKDDNFVPLIAETGLNGMDAQFQCEDEYTGPCMYYARVFQKPYFNIPQENNQNYPGAAWSSPVWVEDK